MGTSHIVGIVVGLRWRVQISASVDEGRWRMNKLKAKLLRISLHFARSLPAERVPSWGPMEWSYGVHTRSNIVAHENVDEWGAPSAMEKGIG